MANIRIQQNASGLYDTVTEDGEILQSSYLDVTIGGMDRRVQLVPNASEGVFNQDGWARLEWWIELQPIAGSGNPFAHLVGKTDGYPSTEQIAEAIKQFKPA